jgi:hypothetical protein
MRGLECGGLCLDGLWKSLWRCVEHRRSCGCAAICWSNRESGKSPWLTPWGLATPSQILETVAHVLARRMGRDRRPSARAAQDAAAKIRAAYEAGCRRFDAAIGGLGGCPFAQDALVGNIPTEMLIAELKELGAQAAKVATARRIDSCKRARIAGQLWRGDN